MHFVPTLLPANSPQGLPAILRQSQNQNTFLPSSPPSQGFPPHPEFPKRFADRSALPETPPEEHPNVRLLLSLPRLFSPRLPRHISPRAPPPFPTIPSSPPYRSTLSRGSTISKIPGSS